MKFNTGYNATKLVDRLISETKLDNSYKDEQMIGIYLALDVWVNLTNYTLL